MKILISLMLLIFSFSSLACSPGRPMAGDLLLLSGVTNKLSAHEFSNFELVRIQKQENDYRVTLKSTQVHQCFDVMMIPKVSGDCSATAEIGRYENADCE
jgi:hypothetical protein